MESYSKLVSICPFLFYNYYYYYYLRSLKRALNGLCLDDDYTIAQWLEHRWLQARVPGSSPGGDSQFFLQTFPVCLFPSNQLVLLLLLLLLLFK